MERRLRPLARPHFRPASLAKSRRLENDLLASGVLLPPMLAISRRLSNDIDANPRFFFGCSGDAWVMTTSCVVTTARNSLAFRSCTSGRAPASNPATPQARGHELDGRCVDVGSRYSAGARMMSARISGTSATLET